MKTRYLRHIILCLAGLCLLAGSLHAAPPYTRFVGGENGIIYAVGDAAVLSSFRHQPETAAASWNQDTFTQNALIQNWGYDHICYSGNGVLYAANIKGELLYYRDTIAGSTHTFVNSPTKVSLGNGWAAYRWLLGDGGGRIYAIDEAGGLFFYQHSEQPNTTWPVPNAAALGSGWQNYKKVIGGRDGIIYAINHAGEMFYYRDLARNGTVNWQFGGAPLFIGNGWNRFQHVFSTGGGHVYGVEPDGEVYYYHISVNNAGVADYTGSNTATPINPGALVVPQLYRGVYCWPLSGAPGDSIEFKISLGGETRIRFSRLYGQPVPGGPQRIFKYEEVINTVLQPVLDMPARLGCGWETTYHWTIPANWESGTYLCQCYPVGASDDPRDRQAFEAPFIVKPSPSQKSLIACLANTNTWNAYNPLWGGSHYSINRSNLSFLRPLTDNVTERSSVSLGEFHLGTGEMWVQSWFERESLSPGNPPFILGRGIRPDVYTDLDFHNGIDLSSYRALFISTHPEYWSDLMYQRLRLFLEAGGTLFYLGGNGIYERVAYSADQTRLILNNGVDAPENNDGIHTISSLFRAATAPTMNERDLLGVATVACGNVPPLPTGSGYVVQRPLHPFMRNVSVDAFGMIGGGENGLHTGPLGLGQNGKAAGLETDNAAGAHLIIGTSCATGIVPGVVATAGPLQTARVVLALAPAAAGGGDAEMIYYPHPGGGFVFSVGSITFGGMLVVDPQLQRLMRNVVQEALRPAPAILSFQKLAPNQYQLRYHGHPGAAYRLEGASTPNFPWLNIGDHTMDTDADEMTLTDTSFVPRFFYRIRRIGF